MGKIIINELEDVIKKYGKPRRTEIIYASDIEDEEEEEQIPDYPVTLFFSKEGYFKKITPQSLRMSSEQKFKDGDELAQTVVTDNSKALLLRKRKGCQGRALRVSDKD